MTWNWPWKAGSAAVPEKKSGTGFVALHAAGEAHWTRRDYAALAREGFMRNPVVHRSVRLISETASAIPWLLYEGTDALDAHPLLDVLERPNQRQGGASFLEALYGHLLLSGNAYVEMISAGDDGARELHLLRPDRVTVLTDTAGWPTALEYREGSAKRRVSLRQAEDEGSGHSTSSGALHLSLFHPLDDHYGFPPLEAALMALDIHNEAGRWNKALLDNSARPSGALVYAPKEGGNLSDEQFVGQPLALFLDLPMGVGSGAPQDQFRIAAWQKPWKSQAVYASPEDTGFVQRTTVGQPADVGMLVESLPPGVSGRPDHSATITVELYGGELSSVSSAQLLNGANVVAIGSASGAWEIVQFETADEIASDVWRLGTLLRGQLGTDDATAAGAEAGAHLVVLDDAVQAAGLLASEAGLALNWRVGPSGSDLSGANFSDHSETGGLRALLPLSPVHLKAAKDSAGDVTLSWTRRGRIDADSWTASDIPLGEEREEYQVQIAHAGGAVVRTATTPAPGFLYDSADIVADFGAPPAEIDVTVRQLSLAAGWGLPAMRRLSLS